MFVFAGILFSGRLSVHSDLIVTLSAFAVFCFAASGVYLFNDVLDKKNDAKHPHKKFRPIASGAVPVWVAVFNNIILWLVAVFWSFNLGKTFALLIIAYIILHIMYTILLKKLVIWDLMAVATGFVLRAVGGAIVIGVEISSWLLVCTSLLSLFLITAKRRAELANVKNGNESRPILKQYSIKYLDDLLLVLVASTITSYTLYVFSVETIEHIGSRGLGLTIPFVFYGLFRYLYLIMFSQSGENPEKVLFTDKAFLLNIIFWVISVVWVVYFY